MPTDGGVCLNTRHPQSTAETPPWIIVWRKRLDTRSSLAAVLPSTELFTFDEKLTVTNYERCQNLDEWGLKWGNGIQMYADE